MVTTRRNSPAGVKVKPTPQEKNRRSRDMSSPPGRSPAIEIKKRRSNRLAGNNDSNNNTLNNDQEIVNSGTSSNEFAIPPNDNKYTTPTKAGGEIPAMLNDPTESDSPANDITENDNNSTLTNETEKTTIVEESINQEKEDGSVVPTNATKTNNTGKIATTPTEQVPEKSCKPSPTKPSPTNNDKNLRDTKSYNAQIHNTMWVYLYPMQRDRDGNIVCESLRTNYNTYHELACKNIMLSFLGHSLPRKESEEGRTSPGHDMEILLVPPEEKSRRVSLYEECPSFRSIVISCTYQDSYSNSSLPFYVTL